MYRPFPLDPRAARRAFDRSAQSAGEASVLAREVERRMALRLQYMRISPSRILDAGHGSGRGPGLVRARYPKAQLIGIDFAEAPVRKARDSARRGAWFRSLMGSGALHHLCADFSRLPFAGGCCGMVWSNLALAWAEELPRALAEFHRVLEPGGLLMFSSYGPDTLKELRAAFAAAGEGLHVHSFVDLHDLGDLLVSSGFAAPVMDMEMFTLTYRDFESAMRDLKASGQVNVARDRPRGLMGKRAWQRVRDAYEAQRRDGRLPLTFEVVYGHGWKGERRTPERAVVRLDLKREAPPR